MQTHDIGVWGCWGSHPEEAGEGDRGKGVLRQRRKEKGGKEASLQLSVMDSLKILAALRSRMEFICLGLESAPSYISPVNHVTTLGVPLFPSLQPNDLKKKNHSF